jgi:hypothetical protein
MSEYVATCTASRHDTITAVGDGTTIELAARSHGERKMETFLSADKARTFARGILALADRIDGGEEKGEAEFSDTPPVGTRVRVLEASGIPAARGMLGTVYDLTDQPGRLKVLMDEPWDGFGYHKVYADRWEIVDEPARPVKVGDRVRVVRNAYDYEDRGYVGRVGTLKVIDTDEQPYRVTFDDDDYWWCAEVELVDEAPDAVSAPEAPAVDKPADERETFIRRAADLASELEIFDDNAIVSMARFLAGE